MTMIAATKVGNEGCIISDIRLTKDVTGTQIDIAEKFRFFEDRIVIYISGEVFVLDSIIKLLENISQNITYENIDSINGPFISEIKNYFDRENPYECSFITLYLDDISSSFKMFRFDFKKSICCWNIKLINDTDFDFEIIGSGEVIIEKEFFPDLSELSLSTVYRNIRNKGYDQLSAVDSIIQSIKIRLNSLGSESYKILGISPIFERTTICNSSLKVWGGNTIGESIDASNIDNWKHWDYSIVKTNGKVQIIDNLTGNEILLSQITDELFNLIENGPDQTFDPSQEEGISFFSPYIIAQYHMHDHHNKKTTIVRKVIKTTQKTYKGFLLPVKENFKSEARAFSGIIKLHTIELLPFSIINYDHYFEKEIKNSSLFDNNVITKYFGENNPLKIT